MDQNKFVHLHVHTEYSLLDCSAKIKELIPRAKELGMDSIAITDHGAMYGAVDFYKAAKKSGIKPIIGCEVYVTHGSRFSKEGSDAFNYFHLVLLAENNEGYQNLIKLVSAGFVEGFYYKPRVDIELLKKYSGGLIALSACLAGPVARTVLQSDYKSAKEIALQYEEIFGKNNFYLELQDHGMADQKLVNSQLIRMNKETGIPLVATNDIHYIDKADSASHDILICIQIQKTVDEEDRMKYEGSEFYLKSAKEMYNLFSYIPEACENTLKIAERCNVDFKFHELHLPKYDVPDGKNAYDYLKELCLDGFSERYENQDEGLIKRLEYELETINKMGYVDYFLIVWDFIKFSRDNGISVGPGRGSAAGSLVSYCLKITSIDPVKYGLIFERFLNPERVSMPDIDIDFCYERRQEVIDYVRKKYGDDHVAQIITFGTLAAKAAIKDVGRALAMPYGDVDKISKMIPFEPGMTMTIKKALGKNKELMALYDEDERIKYLLDMSMKLEGLPRHSSTHAAGVVVCSAPVTEYVPLNMTGETVSTQYTMNTLEELGLLKMDFLGLRTLTVIRDTIDEVKRGRGIEINIDEIDYSDKEVYELITQARTEGVFQLESGGMKQFMKELKPSRLEDLIAGISLYRPGPMDFIPKYVYGKNNLQDIKYTHSSLVPILEDTYGCIVYQEQVMQIVRDLAGYSLGRSDLMRRAMSKKKADVMKEERNNFIYGIPGDIPGCVNNGIPKEAAEKIFDEMAGFAEYAFNKSHAACYAIVGYQTAWLKTHYTAEFMAALMTSVMDNTNKVTKYIGECSKLGITLLPPDINAGYGKFSSAGNKIRFGLAAIKNVGRDTVSAIVEEREKNGKYKSLTDFINRISCGDINKRCIESFIKAGAFDSLGGKRSQYMEVYKTIMGSAAQNQKDAISGQINLFTIGDNAVAFEDVLPKIRDFDLKDKLSMEKEILGFYVSGHPLQEYREIIERYSDCKASDFIASDDEEAEYGGGELDGREVKLCGIITHKSIKYTKKNQKMAVLSLEDLSGTIEVIVFPNFYEQFSGLLDEDNIIFIKGRTDVSADGAKIILNDASSLEERRKTDFPEEKPKKSGISSVGVILDKDNGKMLEDIMPVISYYRGDIPLYVNDIVNGKKFKAARSNWVDGSENMLEELKLLLKEENVVTK